MYKKILFATDGSAHSETVLKNVKGLAKALGAEVLVTHVYRPLPDYVEDLPSKLWDEAVAKAVAGGEEITTKAVRALTEAGVKATSFVVEGNPPDAIIATAKEKLCDLIVVGARGQGEFARYLGSVSFRVSTHAGMPVLIIH